MKHTILQKKQGFNDKISFLLEQTAYLMKTALIIDHIHKEIFFANYKEQFVGIFPEQHTQAIKQRAILKSIHKSDTDLFCKIAKFINTNRDKLKDQYDYCSFTIKITGNANTPISITTSVFSITSFSFSQERDLDISYCNIDLSTENRSGQLTFHSLKDNKQAYCLINKLSPKTPYIPLSHIEVLIFKYTCLGYSEVETSEILKISIGNIKSIKNKIMEYTKTQSTAQIIAILTKQGLI